MKSSVEDRLDQFSAFHKAISDNKGDESEVAQSLIVASYLDHQVRLILEGFVLDRKKIKDALFEGPTAPMGSFSSRILAAYSLGLITKEEHESLTAIRQIRNEFAHKITTSFEVEKMTPFFDKLAWAAGRDKIGELDRSEVLFLASIRLAMAFVNRADHVAVERRTTKEWPDHPIDADMDPDFDPLSLIY
ncbi:hypothetical protein [Sphingobium sp. UBA5915]|uniref:hypothetical protein n=1 Tax=Sphingobium sp. UBA5915 TaxID=1947530 RepID=UPI0025F68371|nr:hypothetical protein [Sphingobium sp. UBA5915]